MKAREKVTAVTGNLKRKIAVGGAAMAVALTSVTPAFAGTDDAGFDLVGTISSGLDSCVDDFMDVVTVVVPIGLSVFAVKWVFKHGLKFFKTSTNG